MPLYHEFAPQLAIYLCSIINASQGFTKEFPSLTALITHHSVMPELLPCPLSLHRYNPAFQHRPEDPADPKDEPNDEDPDYNTLATFRKMMADLNV